MGRLPSRQLPRIALLEEVLGKGSRVKGLEFVVWGFGFKVQDFEVQSWVYGTRFKV